MATECGECNSDKHGSQVDSFIKGFLCFKCMEFSTKVNIYKVSRIDSIWWIQTISSSVKWARVSIEENNDYDNALEAYLAKTITA